MDTGTRQARIPPIVVDGFVALAVLAFGLGSRKMVGDGGFTRGFDGFNLTLIFFQSIPLVLRRRYPAWVLAVTVSAWGVDRLLDYPSTFAAAGMAVAMHAVGSEMSRHRSRLIGWSATVGIALFTLLGSVLYESVGIENVVFMAVALGVPLVLGQEVHDRRARFEQMRLRAERAEQEREAQARRAVREERARIARELHDVVAHQMAVMTLQAEGARQVAGGADPRIAEALDTIRSSGHEGLDEMRRMVGLLRTGEDGADEPALQPQPGLADLDRLAAQMRDAGLEVVVSVEGDPGRIPSGIDLSAYRIVQESLTNTLKHGGPGATSEVRVRYGPDALDIEVADDGRGAAAADGGGHGIVGMRERVALVDGTITTGPAPGGGFLVRASLPLEGT